MNANLKDAASHFQFGENWNEFAASIDQARLDASVASLACLLPPELIAGRDFLDIGSGSGLSAVAALRLGARHVTAVDIDKESVATTRSVLERFAPGASADVRLLGVFDLDRSGLRQFDIVHSWGVLHHTGDLAHALASATRHVRPGGLLVVSVYRRTPLDWFWIAEKRHYTHGPLLLRSIIRAVFKSAYLLGIAATGRSPWRYVNEYSRERGMSWSNDVHDWLGGYPYEPIESTELIRWMTALGFALDLLVERPVHAFGLFGAPCNEYRFRQIG
jgi:2-polyprenyl-6-hydroxyphenyl methylase/3-demethylubiquinone-9 3-methyltransferase